MKTIFIKSKNFVLLLKKSVFLIGILFMLNPIHSQEPTATSGWQFTSYTFKNGSLKRYTSLMGTNSKMYDTISYKGVKGNMTITQSRYDDKTGKLLAGVTYQVVWTDPETVLTANEKSSINYSLTTISSKTWTPPQNSIHFNQGIYGVYFITTDGKKYFNKDINTSLTTEKVIAVGTKGAKKFVQVNLGNGFVFTYNYEWKENISNIPIKVSVVNEGEPAWHFTSYTFKDGSLKRYTNLMGTNSKMYDTISYKGIKGNMTIIQSRYDDKTGKLLAGVTYQVVWTDPETVLTANEKSSINYSLSTISSKTWTPPQNSIRFNQGIYGVYFITPDGNKYFKKDINTSLSTEKVIAVGTKGAKKFIQVNLGNGYMFTYNYEWR